ncbi:MAG: hypothetical protein QF464_22950, partial [Myxococcota bacterium]|nr:hypothetical protein [Myxococcota bacterium]
VQLSLDATIPSGEKWIAGGLGGLVTFAALVAAWRLLTPRGGLWLDTERRCLGLGITGRRDIWWLAFDRIASVVCVRRQITSDVADFAWRTAVQLTNGLEMVLVETHEREIAEDVAEQLRLRLELTDEEDPDPSPTPASGHTTLRVYRAVALHGPLLVASFTLTVLGGALYSQIHVAPAAGFFVAPVLLFTGLALGATLIVKRVATEHITHRGGLWTHAFVCGPFRWAERSVTAPQPVWSLHIRPARGARLQLEADDGVLVIGHGATTRSRADIEALVTLPDRFAPSPEDRIVPQDGA